MYSPAEHSRLFGVHSLSPTSPQIMNKIAENKIADVMTRKVWCVKPSDKLERAHRLFQAHPIHHLPVIDENGKLVGILSKSDFLKVNHMLALFDKQYEAYNQQLYRSMRVEEVMTKEVVSISPEASLSDAMKIFMQNRFHALPVVKHGTVVGILTTFDLMKFCCEL